MLSHEQGFIPALIIHLAQKLIASLVHGLNFSHRQVKVDTQDHYLVTLHAHHYWEYDKAGHYHKDTEKHEGRD
jgi:hypothetical protein